MRLRRARYPILLCLGLTPALAFAQSKPGSLPEAPEGPPAVPGPARDKDAKDKKAEAQSPEKGDDRDKPATDVTRGSGSRNVRPPPSPKEPARPAQEKPAPPSTTYKKGRPPAKPAARLPAGVPRGTPDSAARQHITGGAPTDDDIKRGKSDPELEQLRQAERILFPRPLDGVQLGFDFGIPDAGLDVDASGLPGGVSSSSDRADTQGGEVSWLRGLAEPDLPVVFDERVVRYLRFYRDTPSGRSIARIWAKKAGRFGPAIKAELTRAGLPTDLVWLSLIESGHNPTISSPVGAAGLWQFMPDAARSYGLTVDRWVDERLDPERSTQAALRYLSDLYRRFGSWDLAMAAYNMGYGGLSRSMRKYNTNSFWELCRYEAGIPWETTLYVPKILATAVLMNNRRAFGLDGISEETPERFDVVIVGPSVPLSEIARGVGSTPAEIESLNPQYLAGRTPPAVPGAARASYRVRVPAGSGGKWTVTPAPSDRDVDAYVVRTGDTVESIARARSASERELRELNQVTAGEVLSPGTVLLVPRAGAQPEPDPTSDPELVVVPPRAIDLPGRKRVFYRVVSGDTTAGIASAFHVSSQDLEDWNNIDAQARLEPGMSLQVFVEKHADLSKVLHVPEAHAKILIAGSPEFFQHFEGQRGKKRFVIAARDGDTLFTIGRRYGMSAGQMERVNRRGRRDQLAPGEAVVVYTERGRPQPGDTLLASSD